MIRKRHAMAGLACVMLSTAAPAWAAPSPAAPKANEQDGKVTDQKGAPTDKLTPVEPATEPERPQAAYQLYVEVDVPLLAVATIFGIGRSIRGGLAPAYCAPAPGAPPEPTTRCNPETLNWLDRQVAGRYHPGWTTWSDVGLYGIEALAASGIVIHEGVRRGLNDLVVIAEATLLASAASGMSTAMTGRPRPYMYGTDAPLSVRQNGNGGLSYFSGHTSTSFGAITSTFMTLRRLHADDRWPWLVLAGGATAAGFVGATRVLAGDHFPTDVLAGAVVGTAIGVLVPALHAAPRRMTPAPMAVAGGGGIAIIGELP
ncbi:MAG TPA: phosphatase PAP2 family protein [Polyangia bacterium]|nr:phosphatase PAP2 family protein [Polyangia bacterium]